MHKAIFIIAGVVHQVPDTPDQSACVDCEARKAIGSDVVQGVMFSGVLWWCSTKLENQFRGVGESILISG
jgi:positive regulator of sigma E activity